MLPSLETRGRQKHGLAAGESQRPEGNGAPEPQPQVGRQRPQRSLGSKSQQFQLTLARALGGGGETAEMRISETRYENALHQIILRFVL